VQSVPELEQLFPTWSRSLSCKGRTCFDDSELRVRARESVILNLDVVIRM